MLLQQLACNKKSLRTLSQIELKNKLGLSHQDNKRCLHAEARILKLHHPLCPVFQVVLETSHKRAKSSPFQ